MKQTVWFRSEWFDLVFSKHKSKVLFAWLVMSSDALYCIREESNQCLALQMWVLISFMRMQLWTLLRSASGLVCLGVSVMWAEWVMEPFSVGPGCLSGLIRKSSQSSQAWRQASPVPLALSGGSQPHLEGKQSLSCEGKWQHRRFSFRELMCFVIRRRKILLFSKSSRES